MNIVIVDDETISLSGMEHYIRKNFKKGNIVGTFTNGFDVLSLIKTCDVDLIFTDIKMPKIDGVSLIKKIKEINNDILIVAISSYSDYQYVREAILSGAHDYILKPSDNYKILNILNNAYDICSKKDEDSTRKLYEQELKNLISNKTVNLQCITDTDKLIFFIVSYGDSFDEYLFALIKNLFCTLCSSKHISVHNNNKIVFLLYGDNNINKILPLFKELHSTLNAKNIKTNGFIHSFCNSKDIKNEYSFTNKVVDTLCFYEYNIILDDNTLAEYAAIKNTKNINMGEHILPRILNFEQENLDGFLSHINKSNFAPFMDSKDIKSYLINTLIFIDTSLKKYKDISFDNANFIDIISNSATFSILIDNFKSFISNIYDIYFSYKLTPQYIITAIEFMQNHYMENISLSDIAKQVYMNALYFGIQFKKYTNKSPVNYLNDIRIDKAKQLFQKQDLLIYEVAQKVGFSDSSYFSTVFKSVEGISPKKYIQNLHNNL